MKDRDALEALQTAALSESLPDHVAALATANAEIERLKESTVLLSVHQAEHSRFVGEINVKDRVIESLRAELATCRDSKAALDGLERNPGATLRYSKQMCKWIFVNCGSFTGDTPLAAAHAAEQGKEKKS